MPFLQALAGRGSSGVLRVGQPSLSNPGRAVLVTGAWPETNGVTNNGLYSPPQVDSVFSLARAAGMPRAATGSSFWRRAFGDELQGWFLSQPKGGGRGAPAERLVSWQRQVCAQTLRLTEEFREGFAALGLNAADTAGHDFGGESEAYRQTAAAVDDCLAEVVSSLEDERTTYIVTSDHGHIDRGGTGGHGGAEEEVTTVPLILAGSGIRQAEGWRAEAVDVAPTICALLGLPFPATNQGKVLWHSLDLSPDAERELRRRADQQRRLADERLPDRATVVQAEKDGRLWPAMGALLSFTMIGGLGLRSMGRVRRRWFLAVAVYFALYYVIFTAAGLEHSLSAVNREEYLLAYLGKNVGAALLAGLGAFSLVPRHEADSISHPGLGVAGAVTSIVALQVIWIYYFDGLFMKQFMPDLPSTFEACLNLLQIPAIAIAAVLSLAARSAANRLRF
jgi:hypothetical protein